MSLLESGFWWCCTVFNLIDPTNVFLEPWWPFKKLLPPFSKAICHFHKSMPTIITCHMGSFGHQCFISLIYRLIPTHTIVDVIYRKINTKYVQNSKHIYNIIDSVDIAKGMPNFLPSTFLSIPLFVKTFPLEKIDLKFIDKITFIHDILCLSIIFAYIDIVLP